MSRPRRERKRKREPHGNRKRVVTHTWTHSHMWFLEIYYMNIPHSLGARSWFIGVAKNLASWNTRPKIRGPRPFSLLKLYFLRWNECSSLLKAAKKTTRVSGLSTYNLFLIEDCWKHFFHPSTNLLLSNLILRLNWILKFF